MDAITSKKGKICWREEEKIQTSVEDCKDSEDNSDHVENQPRQSVRGPRFWLHCPVDEKGVDDDVADEEDFHQTKYDETHYDESFSFPTTAEIANIDKLCQAPSNVSNL